MSRDIYEKVCNGDSISDAELSQAVKDYDAAHNALFKLGPAFEVSRKAIGQTLYTLQGFQQLRNKQAI